MILSDSVRNTLRAAAVSIVPETVALDAAGWEALQGTVSRAIAARPRALQRQLLLFVRLIQWLPLLRYGRPFTKLDPARRTRVLQFLQDAPVLLIRRGFWGLRTLILMGYYLRAEAATAVGYRADPRGWKARR